MGRRSRQRASASQRERGRTSTAPSRERQAGDLPATVQPTATAAAGDSRRAVARSHRIAAPSVARGRRAAAPEPPWGSFPLVELCALAAIVLGVWGIVVGNGVLLTGAAFLGSVAGLEVALREHLGGFRSHSLLLAGTLTVATLALLLLAGVARGAVFVIGPLLLLAGFVAFRELFKRRSGGVGIRVR